MSKANTFFTFFKNQKELTEKYCVNLDKPEKMCSGKCYLNEMLAKDHEEESKRSNFVFKFDVWISLELPVLDIFTYKEISEKALKKIIYVKGFYLNPIQTHFGPPPEFV